VTGEDLLRAFQEITEPGSGVPAELFFDDPVEYNRRVDESLKQFSARETARVAAYDTPITSPGFIEGLIDPTTYVNTPIGALIVLGITAGISVVQ